MIINILQIILIVIVFLPVKWFAYWLTEIKGLPEFLNYQPYSCNKCLQFWLLMGIYISLLVIPVYITVFGGITLTILDAIAMHINQKNKTILV